MIYLVPEFTGLGDIIQKTPVIRSIRELDPDSKIVLIGDNRWKGLDMVRGSDLIHDTCNVTDLLGLDFPYNYTNSDITKLYEKLTPQQERTLSEWLRKIEWDVYFDSCHSDVPPVISRLVEQSRSGKIYRHADRNGRESFGFLARFRSRRQLASVELVPIFKGRHDIDSNYDLLEANLDAPFERNYDTWVALSKDDCLLDQWGLHRNEYVCLQPGAANGAATPKTWHPRNFVELSRELTETCGMKVVLLGDQGDQEKTISKFEWPEAVINTAAKTSIEDLGSLVGNAACIVAHDSGIMHIANAMDRPLIALYGPTNYTATRPMGKKSKMLFSKTPAFAIMYRSTKSERKLAEEYPDHGAMAGIKVTEVIRSMYSFSGIGCDKE